MKALPNILTGARLVLSLFVFGALVAAAGAGPFLPEPSRQLGTTLLSLALIAFVVAAVTDFFDGWLARRYQAESTLGAILDPIADKVLVCGALLGLLALGFKEAAIPAGLILFREFAVSALRETLAPRGIKLPVTFLAKTKTTLQLVALTLVLAMPMIAAWIARDGDPEGYKLIGKVMLGAIGLLWLAAVVTVWTGIEYALAARKALKAAT